MVGLCIDCCSPRFLINIDFGFAGNFQIPKERKKYEFSMNKLGLGDLPKRLGLGLLNSVPPNFHDVSRLNNVQPVTQSSSHLTSGVFTNTTSHPPPRATVCQLPTALMPVNVHRRHSRSLIPGYERIGAPLNQQTPLTVYHSQILYPSISRINCGLFLKSRQVPMISAI